MATQQASAPTIRDALLWANEEDDPTSIQPIIDVLCQQGWEVDKQKAGRLFCSLDPFSSAYASLNDRQRTVLKLAIQASAAGLGVGSTGAVAAAGHGEGSTAAGVTLAELHKKVSKMESVLQQHLPFLLPKVLLWRDGSTATHSNSEKDRKTSALKSELQSAGVKGCQLLGEGIPQNCVSLAHLCKLSSADGKMAGSWTFQQDYRSIDNVRTWLQNAELQEPPIAGSVSGSSEVMSMGSAPAAL